MSEQTATLLKSPLDAFHLSQGARMVPFAGWSMPVQYPLGLKGEHLACRQSAGLFDVSHMGQAVLRSDKGQEHLLAALAKLFPFDPALFKANRSRYSLILSQQGGILDDCILSNLGDHVFLVANAARVAHDFAWIQQRLPQEVSFTPLPDRGMIALQGPKAQQALEKLLPAVSAMRFMDMIQTQWQDAQAYVARAGYTGEDGFEISLPAAVISDFTALLAQDPAVALCGLGARDSLRLEAGLPLWGHDIDESTTIAEADLGFAVNKKRRVAEGDPYGAYPSAAFSAAQLEQGAPRKRVGLIALGKMPIREGTVLLVDDQQVGSVCSGTFSPSLECPIAMAYLPSALSAEGTTVIAQVRQNKVEMRVTALPFVAHNYKR